MVTVFGSSNSIDWVESTFTENLKRYGEWSSVAINNNGEALACALISNNQSSYGILYCPNINLNTWTQLTETEIPFIYNVNWQCVSINDNGQALACNDSNGVWYCSKVGVSSWIQVTPPFDFNSVSIANNGKAIAYSKVAGVKYSPDADLGQWSDVTPNLPLPYTLGALGVVINDAGQALLANSQYGLWYNSNTGVESWIQITSETSDFFTGLLWRSVSINNNGNAMACATGYTGV